MLLCILQYCTTLHYICNMLHVCTVVHKAVSHLAGTKSQTVIVIYIIMLVFMCANPYKCQRSFFFFLFFFDYLFFFSKRRRNCPEEEEEERQEQLREMSNLQRSNRRLKEDLKELQEEIELERNKSMSCPL